MRRLYAELGKGMPVSSAFLAVRGVVLAGRMPGIAIPFYLAHPRLTRLERHSCAEVEGGNDKWLMRILRRETGHAIDTGLQGCDGARPGARPWQGVAALSHALLFHRTRQWQASCCTSATDAQSHPTEDFAGNLRGVAAAALALARPSTR